MSPALVAAVWVLGTLDASLMGYRLALGRSALVSKRQALRRGALRGAALAQIPAVVVAVVLVALVAEGPVALGAVVDDAMERFLAVGVPCAVLVGLAVAVGALPSPAARSAANIVVSAPLSLARPLLVVVAVAVAVVPDPRWQLVVTGLAVVVPAVCVEPWADRRIARATVATGCAAKRGAGTV